MSIAVTLSRAMGFSYPLVSVLFFDRCTLGEGSVISVFVVAAQANAIRVVHVGEGRT